ncbi:RICIN domain-containing protein [Streptomyces sp. LP11]|uniref:RICIN domain-containing protein n=1 Tax=Streptomyces pyxinicus TaxID=2970331 RepID=A0ABT2B2C5_9ACTN|nr:RICIN domain-containing protein [Streptomyces sp. LP11]MCS0602676.1 RICIN domain-containing protein [Streptomyces sp. LP11]
MNARHSDKSVSVNGESTDNSAALVQWLGGDQPHQRFRLA